MPSYTYKIFGLNVISEFECPEFQTHDSSINNIKIEFGKVPENLLEPKFDGVWFEIREDEFLLKVSDVADYYVTKNKITIQKNESSDLDSIRVFLYGSAFAALLIQKSIFPFHANALGQGEEAFLIAGDSGAGKSTISTALYKKGYKIFSDDLTVLEENDDGNIKTLPGIIYPKLWEETLEYFEEDKTSLKKINPKINKYRFTKIVNSFDENHKVKHMFVIIKENINKIRVLEKKGHEKIKYLVDNTFRNFFIHGDKLKREHFIYCSLIANKIKLWEIKRPENINTIEEIIGIIENKIAN